LIAAPSLKLTGEFLGDHGARQAQLIAFLLDQACLVAMAQVFNPYRNDLADFLETKTKALKLSNLRDDVKLATLVIAILVIPSFESTNKPHNDELCEWIHLLRLQTYRWIALKRSPNQI